MPDILIRSIDEQTMAHINIAKGDKSREAYLRDLVGEAVGAKMVAQGRLMPNYHDLLHVHGARTRLALDELYCVGLISYPNTLSRYLPEASWPDVARILVQLRRIADSGGWMESDGGTLPEPRFFGLTINGSLFDFMVGRMESALKDGVLPPASLYNEAYLVDHPAISPVYYHSQPSGRLPQAEDFSPVARAVYRQVASAFLSAHWVLLGSQEEWGRFRKPAPVPPGPWNPFRDLSTGQIIAVRWIPEAQAWEVAGEKELVSPTHAPVRWAPL